MGSYKRPLSSHPHSPPDGRSFGVDGEGVVGEGRCVCGGWVVGRDGWMGGVHSSLVPSLTSTPSIPSPPNQPNATNIGP